jgi:phosphotransacetylase
MERQTEKLRLLCELNDNEVMERGIQLADSLKQIGVLEVEKARVTAKIKPIKDEVERLVPIIDQRKEMREVDCDYYYDWDKGKVNLYRADTGETVEGWERNISEDEKQRHFDEVGHAD